MYSYATLQPNWITDLIERINVNELLTCRKHRFQRKKNQNKSTQKMLAKDSQRNTQFTTTNLSIAGPQIVLMLSTVVDLAGVLTSATLSPYCIHYEAQGNSLVIQTKSIKPEITAHQLNGKITVVATRLFAVFNVKKTNLLTTITSRQKEQSNCHLPFLK